MLDADALKNCGNGAGGFQPGNTCARGGDGGDEPSLQHGTSYDRAAAILEEGFKPGELNSVFATPDHRIAVEYGWGKLLKDLNFEEVPDAKFAVVVLKKDTPGFVRDPGRSSTDNWQYTHRGGVGVEHIERVEVYDAWQKYGEPVEVLYPAKKAQASPEAVYVVILLLPDPVKALKAADDTALERFEEFLERAEEDGIITSADAADFRARWGTGNVTPANVPLPLTEAIPDVTAETVLARVTSLGDRVLLAGRPLRAAKRDAMQTAFENTVMKLARSAPEIAEWHEGFVTALSEYMLDEALVGLGEAATMTMTGSQLTTLTEVIQEQLAYLSRFADQRAARAFKDEMMAWEYVEARSALYSGRGRSLWFQADEEVTAGETAVVFYEAVGDDRTCRACRDAEGGSPYLPAEGPMPGDVCEGHGYCRCVRRTVEDAELAALLRGEEPPEEEN
jgi:hypothetical protein